MRKNTIHHIINKMKLLLTSGGITNDTLARELERLAGKSFHELKIAFIPSAAFGDEDADKGWLVDDMFRLKERGAIVDVISLADLTRDEIARKLEPVDVIFVGGGQTFYLSWLMQEKGLFELLPKLLKTKVYVGISAGSMIVTANLRSVSFAIRELHLTGDEMALLGPAGRSSAETLPFVDFLLRPHWNGEEKFADITPEMVQQAANLTGSDIYMLDNDCAVRVVDNETEVVGGGAWKLVRPKFPEIADEKDKLHGLFETADR